MSVSPERTAVPSDRAALERVYTDLGQIYNSLADVPHSDRDIIPWTVREVRAVMLYIKAVKEGRTPPERE
jgi:hypothetical protein